MKYKDTMNNDKERILFQYPVGQKTKNYYLVLAIIFFGIIIFGSFFLLQSDSLTTPPQVCPPQVIVSSGTISEGDSLYNILINEGLSSDQILRLQEELNEIFDPKKIKPGDKYEIVKNSSGAFRSFKYYPNPLKFYVIEKIGSGEFRAFEKQKPLQKNVVGTKIEVKTSLWNAIVELGENPEIAPRLADIFSWQIDFLTELRPGDIFKVTWEKYMDGTEPVLDGHILAAQYQGIEGNKYNAIFFEDKKGYQGYYNLDGESLRRKFLRAPLNYRRISSYFSNNRYHPILRYYRPHLGIDYAAPKGTPVVSVGDGTVIFKGWKGQNGNLIIIRHNSVYTTSYGHLARFAKEIGKGTRVKQGQVIGYVGNTGLATGPHLDFRIKKNNQFVNFLKINTPAADRIKESNKDEFDLVKKERLTQMISLCEHGIELAELPNSRQ